MCTVDQLPIGSLVEFGVFTGRMGYQSELLWQKVSSRNDFMTVDALSTTVVFDQQEPGNLNTARQNNGNNFFPHSNVLQWLNSDALDGWYKAKHHADQYRPGFNYFTRGGFLSAFTPAEKEAMQVVKVRGSVPTGSRQQHGKTYEVDCRVYLPSDVELTGRMSFDHDDVGDQQFEFYQRNVISPYQGIMTRTPYNKSVCCICRIDPYGGLHSVPANCSVRCKPVIRLKPDAKLNPPAEDPSGHVYTLKGVSQIIQDDDLFKILGL